MALPILALQFHEVKINVSIRPLAECLWAVTNLSATRGNQSARAAYAQSLVSGSLYIDYVFCDVDERKSFVSTPHEYLFDQLQFQGDVTVGTASTRLGVNLSHPVQEIIFVAQPNVNVDYCASYEAGEALFNVLGAQTFNYTDALDALPNAMHAFGSPDALYDTVDSSGNHTQGGFMTSYSVGGTGGSINYGFQQPFGATLTSGANFDTAGNFTMPSGSISGNGLNAQDGSTINPYTGNNNQVPFAAAPGTNAYTVGLSDPAIYVISETAHAMHCWGENPIVTCRLSINNQDRFSEREGIYFDTFLPFQYHTRAPDTGINVYSFALNPEALQPSGTLNFSRVDNAFLIITLSAAAISQTATCQVRVYGRGKNVVRVLGGMCGVAFAS